MNRPLGVRPAVPPARNLRNRPELRLGEIGTGIGDGFEDVDGPAPRGGLGGLARGGVEGLTSATWVGTGIVMGGFAVGGLVISGEGIIMGEAGAGTGFRCDLSVVPGEGADALREWAAAIGKNLSGSSVTYLACPLVPTVGEAVNSPGLYGTSLASVGW
jgi:hypothetical protein